ncbi:hypothetical protein N7510_009320 [Penicillium lagena]|uniref:uncharacterized protein n=1 Tax=Penicillium lagena TaxID=94218 RepID=UPI00254114AC|nr:uncharacterized protein N7510_009320 [Penicillium lagena]KAJ5606539.1 hypothetical protein N7510_009320 [Penicillium lagena]
MTITQDPPTVAFDALPLNPNGPRGNAWGRFGPTDQLGTLNLLTPERVVEAAKEIRSGVRISLDWPLSMPSYPSFNRSPFKQELVLRNPNCVYDDILTFNSQGVTGRGILLDYAEWATSKGIPVSALESTPITLENLKQAAADYKLDFRKGDIFFVRSGFTAAYNKLSAKEREDLPKRPSPDFSGVEATEEMVRWLWEHQFAAVAGDAPSFERSPIRGSHANPEFNLHEWILAGWGTPIGEMFDLEKLSEHCKATGRYTFFLSSMPLKVCLSWVLLFEISTNERLQVVGGVASPPNAFAIF